MHSMFGNTYVCESTFPAMKQVKSENRNRMADETPDHSLRIATNDTFVLLKERVSEKPHPQASHW